MSFHDRRLAEKLKNDPEFQKAYWGWTQYFNLISHDLEHPGSGMYCRCKLCGIDTRTELMAERCKGVIVTRNPNGSLVRWDSPDGEPIPRPYKEP